MKFRKQFMSHMVKKLNGTFVIFDLETSGLDPKLDRIIQIAAIKAEYKEDKFQEIDRLNLYINPGFPISKKIEDLTGISNEMLQKEKTEDMVFNEIYQFFGELPICCGYNILAFDIPFLKELYRRHDKIFVSPNALDILCMARDLVSVKNTKTYKLGDVARYYDICEGLQFHNAMDDVIASYRLFILFFREYQKEEKKEKSNVVPHIFQHYTWQGKRHDLARIYFCTNLGKIYFDIYKYEWGSKEVDLQMIDLDRFIEQAYQYCCPGKIILNDDEFYHYAKKMLKES